MIDGAPPDKDREQVIENSLRGAPPAKDAWPQSTSQNDITSDVAAPTIVIAGELDVVDSIELLKAALLSRVPHAVLQIVLDTGHLLPLKLSKEHARLIREFADVRAAGKLTQEQSKALVLGAFDTLFNKRDCAAGDQYWSDGYIQRSAHIAPSPDGLFNQVRTVPRTLKYENHVIAAEEDYVISHGRVSGSGRQMARRALGRAYRLRFGRRRQLPRPEAIKAQSLGGLPMFGDRFPDRRPAANPQEGAET